jgi:predicted SnoaL-like aldol condensation-catalyzing enzyme
MKNSLLCILLSVSLVACTNTADKSQSTENQSTPTEHIYKPTYTDNFKIGDQKNVLLAEQFHKFLFEKDFKQAGDLIADTALFNNEDGSTLKGKAAIVDYMQKNFEGVTFKNFQIAAILPVVGENGHQWVDIWDEADIETPDGKTQKMQWVDAFRFENGKIVHFIGFGKTVKN